ncbi:uncharacterized protein LOC128966438 [Oppia nitens]|uniref:uncharacterized protein LOC128966438 n=1 Tax=Oppia nitens TaxID=1686743 RepID=UPI0023DC4A36|nr:uncharacterized protein LOC128966438 [Oppia nitens]
MIIPERSDDQIDDSIRVTKEPQLLGIFADGVNDENDSDNQTNVLKTNNFINSSKLIDHNSEDIERISIDSTDSSGNSNIEETTVLPLNVTQVSAQSGQICGTFDGQFKCLSAGQVPLGYTNFLHFSATNGFFDTIPAPGETIDPKSYVAMKVEISSSPGGEVFIIDMISGRHLLYYNNKATVYMSNHFDKNYEEFVSDSNYINIQINEPLDDELVLPFKRDDLIKPEEVKYYGSRTYTGKNGKFLMTIQYYEMQFAVNEQQLIYNDPNHPDGPKMHQEAVYVANSVVTYIMKPPPPDQSNNISVGLQVDLEHLDIDVAVGDYLLVGPGDKPTYRELSKAQIISENILKQEQEKTLYFYSDSAYIRLVTHNSLKKGTALKFTWRPPNDTVQDLPEEKVPKRIRDAAIQLCILDIKCGQFNVSYSDGFVSELVHKANQYLFGEHAADNDAKNMVSKRSVRIFNEEDSGRVRNGRNDISCQMEMAITNPWDWNWPMVKHSMLYDMFFHDGNRWTTSSLRDLKTNQPIVVTDCSQQSLSFWRIILPIIIIIIVSVVIMLVAWRYQYHNWAKVQNQPYMNAPIAEPVDENILYAKGAAGAGGPKDNPLFMNSPPNNRKTHTDVTIKSIDSVDSDDIDHQRRQQQSTSRERSNTQQTSDMSGMSSISSKKLASVKESPEFVRKLFRQQNEYVLEGSGMKPGSSVVVDYDDTDDSSPPNRPIDIRSKTFSSAKALTYDDNPTVSFAGLNGTQHESLRSYPRSALRQRTIENEKLLEQNQTNPFRNSTKVQFDVPLPQQQQQQQQQYQSYNNNDHSLP